jgi:hypothetical protein
VYFLIYLGISSDFQFPDAEVDNVATLLKRYFKEMKNPILTHALYKQFIACECIIFQLVPYFSHF